MNDLPPDIDGLIEDYDSLIMSIIATLLELERVCRHVRAARTRWISKENEGWADTFDDAIYQHSLKVLLLQLRFEPCWESMTDAQILRVLNLHQAFERLTERWTNLARSMGRASANRLRPAYSRHPITPSALSE